MSTHQEDSYIGHPEEFAKWIIQVINDALEFSTPRVNTNVHKTHVYWWNEDILRLRRTLIASRRAWTRSRRRLLSSDPHYRMVFSTYKKAKKNLKKAIRRAKGFAWRELIQNLNDDPWGLPFKLVLSKLRKIGPGITETVVQ